MLGGGKPGQLLTQQIDRVVAQSEPRRDIIFKYAFMQAEARQLGFDLWQALADLLKQRQRSVCAKPFHRPQSLTPLQAIDSEGIGPREPGQSSASNPSAPPNRFDRAVPSPARRRDPVAILF